VGEKVRLAIIGLGAQGKQHIESFDLIDFDNAELCAVVDLDAALAKSIAEQTGTRAYSDLDLFFKQAPEFCDAVIVCVPNKFHCETVLNALSAGLHALTEKPIATSLAECDRMIAASEAAGKQFMVSHNLLFYEPHTVITNMIASGELKRPHEFRTRLTCGDMYGSWRDRADLCGGGLLIDSGAHRFYTARQMMGEVKSVTAWLDTRNPREVGEETAFVIMEFEQGGVGLIDSTFHAPGDVFDDLIELISKDGTIWIPGSEAEYLKSWSHPPVTTGSDIVINRTGIGGEWEVIQTPKDDWARSVAKSAKHFAACILGDEEPITSAAEGRRNLAVLEATYLSGMERRAVDISEVG
jgi:predicted dehydrogenase